LPEENLSQRLLIDSDLENTASRHGIGIPCHRGDSLSSAKASRRTPPLNNDGYLNSYGRIMQDKQDTKDIITSLYLVYPA